MVPWHWSFKKLREVGFTNYSLRNYNSTERSFNLEPSLWIKWGYPHLSNTWAIPNQEGHLLFPRCPDDALGVVKETLWPGAAMGRMSQSTFYPYFKWFFKKSTKESNTRQYDAGIYWLCGQLHATCSRSKQFCWDARHEIMQQKL